MGPAKPAHLERFPVIVVMRVDPDAIVFRSPADLARLLVQRSRSERPLYGDMGRILAWVGPPPVRLSGVALETTGGIFRELFSGEITAGDDALTGLRRSLFTVCS